MIWGRALLFLLIVTGDAHGADCSLRPVATLPLRDTAGFLTVPVVLAQRTVSMLVDTGSEAGLLSPQAARGMTAARRRALVNGTGGRAGGLAVAIVPSVVLGGLSLTDMRFPVGVLPASPRIVPPVEGLIGADLLSNFEIEIDMQAGTLGLWQARNLSSLCRDLPPWQGRIDSVALTRVGDRMVLHTTLDGHSLTALLDSGARSRIVSRRAAVAAGLDAAALDTEPGGVTSGIDGRNVVYHWHRFGSLAIGPETDLRPVLTVTPLAEQADMLLGADWFERHRVWISYATSRLFMQPRGQR